MPSVITANHLLTGDVVYLGPEATWPRDLADARVLWNADELGAAETIAADALAARRVTAIYAFDVSVVDGRPHPISIRERIRAAHAPTI